MYIRRLAASFGCLERAELSLQPGFNIIEAPNEGGKSTWTTFIQIMFYGLNTRDRSPTADKRRFQPWSGLPMEGTLELSAGGRDITLTRRTVRAGSPMSAFSAAYTGASTPVDGLTAGDCGELLLGVPQEVYTRSAQIRQGSAAIDGHASLEQRVNSLITTGEEDVSCSAVSDRLRRQLNRRRHNQTGLLPQLERELTAVQTAQGELKSLDARLRGCEKDRAAVQAQIQNARLLLSRHEAADRADSLQRQSEARREAQAASLRLSQLAQQARQRSERSAEALRQAEETVSTQPPPEEPSDKPPRLLPWPLLALPPVLAAVLLYKPSPIAAAGALTAAALILIVTLLLHTRRKKRWAEDQSRRREEAAAYQSLLDVLESARAAHQADLDALSAAEAACEASLRSSQSLTPPPAPPADPVQRPALTKEQLQNSLRADRKSVV